MLAGVLFPAVSADVVHQYALGYHVAELTPRHGFQLWRLAGLGT